MAAVAPSHLMSSSILAHPEKPNPPLLMPQGPSPSCPPSRTTHARTYSQRGSGERTKDHSKFPFPAYYVCIISCTATKLVAVALSPSPFFLVLFLFFSFFFLP